MCYLIDGVWWESVDGVIFEWVFLFYGIVVMWVVKGGVLDVDVVIFVVCLVFDKGWWVCISGKDWVMLFLKVVDLIDWDWEWIVFLEMLEFGKLIS